MERLDNEPKFNEKDIVDKGSSAVIYNLPGNSCYKKIYNKDFISEDQTKVLETIKNLQLYNFCKIRDIYYNDEGKVIGYSMPRYENIDITILSLPKDYLLDSYRNIYNDIMKLSEKFIFIKDLSAHNVFYTDRGIIIYDYDLYTMGDSIDYALIHNKAKLNSLFNELLSYELTFKYNFDPRVSTDKVNELFNARTDINTLEESLNKFNRPIDFIRGNYGIIR